MRRILEASMMQSAVLSPSGFPRMPKVLPYATLCNIVLLTDRTVCENESNVSEGDFHNKVSNCYSCLTECKGFNRKAKRKNLSDPFQLDPANAYLENRKFLKTRGNNRDTVGNWTTSWLGFKSGSINERCAVLVGVTRIFCQDYRLDTFWTKRSATIKCRVSTEDMTDVVGDEDERQKPEESESEVQLRDRAYVTATTGQVIASRAMSIQDSLPPEGLVVLFSCAVGVTTGVGVVLFNLGVHEIHDIVWEGIPHSGATWLRTQPIHETWQHVVLIPVGGGVVVGALNSLRSMLEGQRGNNPGMLTINSCWNNATAFTRQVLKTAAAAVTLGTGGSLGPEGPSVEIGASIANGFGTVLKNSRERKLSLVAAGSAAGISSGFNAAVAGTFFAVESVLRPSSTDSTPALTTAMVLLSSVLASVVSQAGLGSDPAFKIPAYDFRSPAELPLYLLLGILSGGVSVALTTGTAFASSMFASLQKSTGAPSGLLPPLGGLCVGIIALAYPEILYWGFENVDVLLESHLPWSPGPDASLLAQLVVAKMVATSLCRGSGLVGGVYAPSLFIGAALGSAYGKMATYALAYADPMYHLDALRVAAPQAYALVGMAAVLAGVCQVPLTAVLLLFELTRDYRIILPLMAAVGLSSWIASSASSKKSRTVAKTADMNITNVSVGRSARNQPLRPVVVSLSNGSELSKTISGTKVQFSGQKDLCKLEDTLCLADIEVNEEQLADEIPVAAAMRTKYASVTVNTPVSQAVATMIAEKEWCVVVLNQNKFLNGILTLADIQQEAEKARAIGLQMQLENRPVSAFYKTSGAGEEIQLVTVYPDMSLKAAQRLMEGRGLRQLPVVARNFGDEDPQSGRLVLGLLDRETIRISCRAEATRRLLGLSISTVSTASTLSLDGVHTSNS